MYLKERVVSYESMTVKFDKPLLTPQIKPNVDDETYVKPFSLKYKLLILIYLMVSTI